MAGAVMNKIWDFFGMDNSAEEEEAEDKVYDYDYEEEDEAEEPKTIFGRNKKVVNMPQTQQIKMVISQPTTFEQSEEICNYLKERKSVIVNLEYVNKDVARRIVDFISGSVHALDGHIQKISNSIFLIAPTNYEIANEMAREEIKNRLSVSWLKNN
jgi:cell division inhibitor SepF